MLSFSLLLDFTYFEMLLPANICEVLEQTDVASFINAQLEWGLAYYDSATFSDRESGYFRLPASGGSLGPCPDKGCSEPMPWLGDCGLTAHSPQPSPHPQPFSLHSGEQKEIHCSQLGR
jgi:hypothetical protein